MSKRPAIWRRLQKSVFTKLVAIMLTMGLVLPITVGGFFVRLVHPAFNGAAEGLLSEYMELFAASAPDLETAKRAAALHGVAIRYEGPAGGFATDPSLPSIAETAKGGVLVRARAVLAGRYRVVTRPDGSAYLFAWNFERDLAAAHNRMLVVLLVFIVLVVYAGHAFLRRALRPLGRLAEGVAAVSDGNLAISVSRTTDDEFGALADAFNRMVERVRQMLTARDQLLLDVSHELRSPLTRMKVALELCRDDEYTKRLSCYVAEMEALVTELLELERLRQGNGLRIEKIDLVKMVRDVVRACAEQKPGVELGECPERVLLSVDVEKVRRVLSNLLENASKNSLPDSRPTKVSVVLQRQDVVVRVEDDGPGIPEESLPSVFEPFFRVDRSRSRRTGGYGLGLSLCKRILEAHGGTIGVANRVGRGAAFEFSLPIADP